MYRESFPGRLGVYPGAGLAAKTFAVPGGVGRTRCDLMGPTPLHGDPAAFRRVAGWPGRHPGFHHRSTDRQRMIRSNGPP
jgi:hypothetical protein